MVEARRNQYAAARPAYDSGPPCVASTLASIEPTAEMPTADPSWRAPLNIAPTVPAMDDGLVRKMAMLGKYVG